MRMPEKEVVFEGEVSRRPQVGLRSPLGCTEHNIHICYLVGAS